MKRSLQHRMNRLFRRRGGLPRSARLPRAAHDAQYRRGAFGRPRLSPQNARRRRQQWLWRAALAALAAGVIWFAWQSWIGLRVFDY